MYVYKAFRYQRHWRLPCKKKETRDPFLSGLVVSVVAVSALIAIGGFIAFNGDFVRFVHANERNERGEITRISAINKKIKSDLDEYINAYNILKKSNDDFNKAISEGAAACKNTNQQNVQILLESSEKTSEIGKIKQGLEICSASLSLKNEIG